MPSRQTGAVAQEWCDGSVRDTGQRGQGVLVNVAVFLHSSHLLTFENVFLNLRVAGFAVKKHCLG